MDSADVLLYKMMYRLRPVLNLSSLRNDMSVIKQGYSFVQDSRNNLATKYLKLSSQACLDSESGLMSGESWNLKAVRHYLDQDHELLKQLSLIMYLSGGQAPRSTESYSVSNARMARLPHAACIYTTAPFVTSHAIQKVAEQPMRNFKSPVTFRRAQARFS
jgi:hypothetical protein